jgi:hypothetical protein
MGNTSLEAQVGSPIDNNLIALVITNQTDRVISKVEADPSSYFLREGINFRGDTLLHYACAKNNFKLVEYLLKKNPALLSRKNTHNQLASDLTTDPNIKSVCTSRV